ncbi:MAG: Tm-1-like ATP-binding domain-containing protein [Deltaproteobacteria bacterium]|nr:Tm-1-like ATP-binding domain-containing protein [Deltaproteobacteria bacterium]
MPKNPTVLLIATLDTKIDEAEYILKCLEDMEINTLILDPSVRESGKREVTIAPEDVAKEAGTTLEAVRALGHEGKALSAMTKGSIICAKALFEKTEINGIISLGGSMGTGLGTAVMREFPFGLPKVMISTMASGMVKPYVGTKDILMLHSVADISGLNSITGTVLRNGASAVAGMAKSYQKSTEGEKPIIMMSMLATVESCSRMIRAEMEKIGYEVIIFHTSGTGGAAMDELVLEKNVAAVVDLSIIEVTDFIYHGLFAATPDRCQSALKKGIPVFFAAGNLDFMVGGPLEAAKRQFPGKRYHVHNAQLTAVRTGPEEMEEVAKYFGKAFSDIRTPTEFFIPLKGFSNHDSEQGHLHDLSMPPIFEELLRKHCPADTPITALPYHINDPEFAVAITGSLKKALGRS